MQIRAVDQSSTWWRPHTKTAQSSVNRAAIRPRYRWCPARQWVGASPTITRTDRYGNAITCGSWRAASTSQRNCAAVPVCVW